MGGDTTEAEAGARSYALRPKLRGSMITHFRPFVTSTLGALCWGEFLAHLPLQDRTVVRDARDTSWYDTRLFISGLHVLESLRHPREGGDVLAEFGRFQANSDLTTIQRAFMWLATPPFILEKSGAYWSRFHSRGRWTTGAMGRNGARGTLHDFIVDPKFCRYLGGYIEHLFELTGVTMTRFDHIQCRSRGDSGCTYEGEWR